jgi:hypothetical protein
MQCLDGGVPTCRGPMPGASASFQAEQRRWPRRDVRRALIAGLLLLLPAPARATVYVYYSDPGSDWLARPTDPDGLLPFDLGAHVPIDLLEVKLGRWRPDDPVANLFQGRYLPPGKFMRLDLTIAGLVNPPGATRPWEFDPFVYGPNPVYGFVELDMDWDVETGGELDTPQYRYVGNAVRFGGKPAVDPLEDRFALDESAFDGDFETPPFVDRSGEEFHLALLGSVFEPTDVTVVVGDADLLFEAGETWWITAPWFHRAHGYEPFSLASGGHGPGVYEPPCTLSFAHDAGGDTTLISLVFPLTNEGAAEMWDQPAQPPNADPSDQFSVHEALVDLHWSAVFIDAFPTGLPEEAIILEWKDKDPGQYLNPPDWRVSALLGTSYTAAHPTGEYFLWTDVLPDAVRGDMDGDGEASQFDQVLIQGYIDDHDGDDGAMDGRVAISGHPLNFSVLDVDQSGSMDPLDVALVSVPGDLDADDDVDLADLAVMQSCVSGSDLPYDGWECGLADLDTDGDVDAQDWQRISDECTGPGSGGCGLTAR